MGRPGGGATIVRLVRGGSRLTSVFWTVLALLAFVVAAVAWVCLAVPLVVSVRAPDEGDLFSVKLRHAALSVDVWLPIDVVLHWVVGRAEPPPISGHVAGIPIPPRALAPVGEAIAKAIAGIGQPKPEKPPEPEKKPERFDAIKKHAIAAAPNAAWNTLPRFRRAVVIEIFAFDLLYGAGDPITNGLIAGYLWQLAAILPAPFYIRAEANWMEPTLKAKGEARILIFPWRTIVAVLCLLLAVTRGAWKATRNKPPSKEIDSWPIRTETPAVAAPSNPS